MITGTTMFTRAALLDLFDHMTWADAMVWSAVTRCDAAGGDQMLRGYLAHLHAVQRAFLDVWREQPPTFADPSTFPDLDSIRAFAASYYDPARTFIEQVEQPRLETTITLPWHGFLERKFGRSLASPTVAETMVQVTTHTGYHRGQVNARLRAIGGEPPLVDYIAWLWFGRPQPEWT
jgi:uncharacterized damage-inducible protein DinB